MPLFCSVYSLPGTASPWQPHSQSAFITSLFVTEHIGKEVEYIYFVCIKEKGRDDKFWGKSRGFFFPSICLLPGWIWVKKKWLKIISTLDSLIHQWASQWDMAWTNSFVSQLILSFDPVVCWNFSHFSPVHWGLSLATQAWSIWLRGKSQNTVFKDVSCQKRKVKTLEWMIFSLF